jgi:hypothetical protein
VSSHPNGLVAVTELMADKHRIAHLEAIIENLATYAAESFTQIERLTLQAAAYRTEARAQARRADIAIRELQAATSQLDELRMRIATNVRAATAALGGIVDAAI